jgi:hypothetical protein
MTVHHPMLSVNTGWGAAILYHMSCYKHSGLIGEQYVSSSDTTEPQTRHSSHVTRPLDSATFTFDLVPWPIRSLAFLSSRLRCIPLASLLAMTGTVRSCASLPIQLYVISICIASKKWARVPLACSRDVWGARGMLFGSFWHV